MAARPKESWALTKSHELLCFAYIKQRRMSGRARNFVTLAEWLGETWAWFELAACHKQQCHTTYLCTTFVPGPENEKPVLLSQFVCLFIYFCFIKVWRIISVWIFFTHLGKHSKNLCFFVASMVKIQSKFSLFFWKIWCLDNLLLKFPDLYCLAISIVKTNAH